jgi:mutator protein MutT
MERAIDVSNAVIISPHDEVLLLQRSEHLKQSNLWGLPGGMVEAKETPQSAVFRELREETGIRDSDVECCDEGAYTVAASEEKIRMYVMLSRLIACTVMQLNPREHTDYVWENLDALPEREDLLPGIPVIINSLLCPEARIDRGGIIQPTNLLEYLECYEQH